MLSIKVEARMRNILFDQIFTVVIKFVIFFPMIYKDDSSGTKEYHKHNVIIFKFKNYQKDGRNEPKKEIYYCILEINLMNINRPIPL